MKFAASDSFVRAEKRATHVMDRWFPAPRLLMPRAAGIDISESSIKWISLKPLSEGYEVEYVGERSLEEGIIMNGLVENEEGLAAALADVRSELGGIQCAHAALPEEAAYLFTMHVPHGTSHEQALQMIEFEFEGRVPIPPSSAVYDFDVIEEHGDMQEISVSVFPRDLSQHYVDAFAHSGLTLLSLELEARSIARAVSDSSAHEPISLIVDFGRARSGLSVVKRGVPIFTSTVEVGADSVVRALMQSASLSPDDAERFMNDEGLAEKNPAHKDAYEAALSVASALADEVARHFHYWDTRRNDSGERMTPVGKIVLVGGSANMRGLADYVAGRVQAETEIGDVWRHVYDFSASIPPLDKHHSLQFATAIGLALRAVV